MDDKEKFILQFESPREVILKLVSENGSRLTYAMTGKSYADAEFPYTSQLTITLDVWEPTETDKRDQLFFRAFGVHPSDDPNFPPNSC